jgi:serine/threonine protein kinase
LGTISEDYFHLVTTMIKYDFQRRFTIDEIKEHPWYNGPVATPEEVKKELESRKKEINQRLSTEEDSDDVDPFEVAEKHSEALEEVTRSFTETPDNLPPRKIKIYDRTVPKLTEFFSTFKPNVLLGALVNFVKLKQIYLGVDNFLYKATVQMSSEEENIVDFVVEIQKVKENHESQEDELADSEDEDNWEEIQENESDSQLY